MSRIMRQLEAEGRAAREAERKAKEPPAGQPSYEIIQEEVPAIEWAICRHGLALTETCFACGRVGVNG